MAFQPRACLVFLLALASPAYGSTYAAQLQVKGTPVQKVIEMMNEMLAKGQAEKETEAKVFKEYVEWVDDQTRELGFQIKTAKASIEELQAEADKADADVADLTEKIAELDGLIAGWEADQKAATGLRDGENAEYKKISTDLGESNDALDRAINVLSKQQGSTAQALVQGEMLLQRMAVTTRGMRRVLAAFLEQKAETADAASVSGGPAVAAYASQSGGIVEMLEKLKKKFKAELDQVEEEEANKAHAYDLEMLHLGNSIEDASGDRQKKMEVNAQRKMDSAEAKGELANTQAELADAEKLLAETKATFLQKSAAFESNQKVRAEELVAITKAVEIISGSAVSGSADKHLPGLVQQPKALSFLQVRESHKAMGAREQVVALLQERATTLGSKVLSMAAMRVGFDPFAKVVDMIQKLITRLEEEAAAEAGHKAWCDGELKENKLSRDALSSEVAELTATKEKFEGEIAALAKELEELAAAQAALAKAMKEATVIRETEKEENLSTIKDAKEAQEAVQSALTILKEFYAKQAALLQQAPEMKAYKGQGGASTGVVGMLDVILSDFARLEAETTADEMQAVSEYDEFMADSKADTKAKHDLEFKQGLIKDKKEHELKLNNKDLTSTSEELAAALNYFEELKPMCLEVHVSYEERVQKRKEEIEALGKAYKILSAQ